MTFELVDPPEGGWEAFYASQPEPKRYGNRGIPSAQCACGRFAKFRGIRKHYNGTWTLETLTVECSRCGLVDIELV